MTPTGSPSTEQPLEGAAFSMLGCSLLGHLASWTDARQPLPELLRALADEYAGRSRKAFWRLAERLEAGDPLDKALAATRHCFPLGMRRQLQLAADSGDLATVLPALAAQEAGRGEVRRQVVSSLLYPALILGFSLAMTLAGSLLVMPQFEALFDEFELELPPVTELVLWAAHGTPQVLTGVAIASAVAVVLWVTPGVRRFAHWLATAPPLFGTLWVWMGHESLCQQLTAYLAARTPLPTALRGAAAGLGDRNLARSVRLMAGAVEAGAPLSEAMSRSIHIERPLTAVTRWGEQSSTLPDALAEASLAYREQINQQLKFVQRVASPVMILTVGTAAIVVVIAVLLPLVKLIEGLT